MTRWSAAVSVVGLVLIAFPARAQTSAEDRAAADALYVEGGALMKAGRFADACPKLETSQRLDPGVGALIRLGFCYENVGRTASAWSAYNDAEALARKANDKRAEDAAGRAKAVEPKLSRLLIALEDPAATTLDVRRDGKPMDRGLLGTAVPVDPGAHIIEATAPGKKDWKTTVEVQAKPGTTTVRVPVLEDAPKEAPAVREKPAEGASFWGAQRIAGASVTGVGVAALAVGAALGGLTLAKASSLKGGHCSADLSACDATGLALRQDAKAMGTASTGVLIAGGVVVVAGVAVLATGAKRGVPAVPKSTARVVLGPIAGAKMSGLLVRGGW